MTCLEKPSFFNRCNFWYKPRTRGKYYSECYRITQILISTLIYLKNLKYTYLEVFIFLGYADDFFILTNLPEDLFFNIFIIMFSNITVVNVDGRTGDNLSTQMALLYSQSKLPGSKSLLIAPQEPKITIGNFDFAKIKEAHEWCQSQVRECLRNGKSVIVSNTFVRKWEMEVYIKIAKELGINYEIKRMIGGFQNVHGVPETIVERMRRDFEI